MSITLDELMKETVSRKQEMLTVVSGFSANLFDYDSEGIQLDITVKAESLKELLLEVIKNLELEDFPYFSIFHLFRERWIDISKRPVIFQEEFPTEVSNEFKDMVITSEIYLNAKKKRDEIRMKRQKAVTEEIELKEYNRLRQKYEKKGTGDGK